MAVLEALCLLEGFLDALALSANHLQLFDQFRDVGGANRLDKPVYLPLQLAGPLLQTFEVGLAGFRFGLQLAFDLIDQFRPAGAKIVFAEGTDKPGLDPGGVDGVPAASRVVVPPAAKRRKRYSRAG